jgi:hypothetical protein
MYLNLFYYSILYVCLKLIFTVILLYTVKIYRSSFYSLSGRRRTGESPKKNSIRSLDNGLINLTPHTNDSSATSGPPNAPLPSTPPENQPQSPSSRPASFQRPLSNRATMLADVVATSTSQPLTRKSTGPSMRQRTTANVNGSGHSSSSSNSIVSHLPPPNNPFARTASTPELSSSQKARAADGSGNMMNIETAVMDFDGENSFGNLSSDTTTSMATFESNNANSHSSSSEQQQQRDREQAEASVSLSGPNESYTRAVDDFNLWALASSASSSAMPIPESDSRFQFAYHSSPHPSRRRIHPQKDDEATPSLPLLSTANINQQQQPQETVRALFPSSLPPTPLASPQEDSNALILPSISVATSKNSARDGEEPKTSGSKPLPKLPKKLHAHSPRDGVDAAPSLPVQRTASCELLPQSQPPTQPLPTLPPSLIPSSSTLHPEQAMSMEWRAPIRYRSGSRDMTILPMPVQAGSTPPPEASTPIVLPSSPKGREPFLQRPSGPRTYHVRSPMGATGVQTHGGGQQSPTTTSSTTTATNLPSSGADYTCQQSVRAFVGLQSSSGVEQNADVPLHNNNNNPTRLFGSNTQELVPIVPNANIYESNNNNNAFVAEVSNSDDTKIVAQSIPKEQRLQSLDSVQATILTPEIVLSSSNESIILESRLVEQSAGQDKPTDATNTNIDIMV